MEVKSSIYRIFAAKKQSVFIVINQHVCYDFHNIKSGQGSLEQFYCPNVYQAHLNFKVFSPKNFNLMKIEDEGVWCV